MPLGTSAVGANASFLNHQTQDDDDDAALKAAIQVTQLNTKYYNTQLSTKYYSTARPETMPPLRLLSMRYTLNLKAAIQVNLTLRLLSRRSKTQNKETKT